METKDSQCHIRGNKFAIHEFSIAIFLLLYIFFFFGTILYIFY